MRLFSLVAGVSERDMDTMQKHSRLLLRVLIPMLALLMSAWVVQAWDKRTPPPAGDYPCLTSRLGYSAVQGPTGPLMTIQYDPSVLGTLHLDGKGGYRASRSSGRYSFDAATGKFTFVSGGLAGWPVIYEIKKGTPTVRLAATKDKGISAAGKVGDHACRRRGTER